MDTISIITICYNNLEELKGTIESVDSQILFPSEHIIVDGSTNQEIYDFLSNKPCPQYRKWISEQDNGIADAMNKGIRMSTGKIILMLNAGDRLYDNFVLEKVSQEFKENQKISWLHGKYEIQRGGFWVIIGKAFERKKLYRGMRSICHQTMYIKKELYDKYGLYDANEKIAMDYDFLCRIAEERFLFLEIPLAKFAPSGISSIQYLDSLKAAKKIYSKYYGTSILLCIWQLRLKILYYLLQTSLGRVLFKIKKKMKLENM